MTQESSHRSKTAGPVRFARLTALARALCLALVLGLAAGSLPVQAADPQTPEEMYKLAVRLLDRGYYQRSVELLERIKTRYPFSQYAVLSELRIGDSHFKKSEYPEAVDAYQTFIKLHPRHPEVDYVIYMIAKSEYKQAPTIVQRDQGATKRMISAIQTYEERFPQSKYLDEVKQMRLDGRRRLAKGVFGIGKYYYARGRFQTDRKEKITALEAAIGRFEQTIDEYPDVKDVGAQAMYYLGVSQARLQRKQDAASTLERMKTRFPDSSYISKLERRVARAKDAPLKSPPRVKDDGSPATPETGDEAGETPGALPAPVEPETSPEAPVSPEMPADPTAPDLPGSDPASPLPGE